MKKEKKSQHRAIFQNNFFKCDDNTYGLFCVVVIVIIGKKLLLVVVIVFVRVAGVLSW